MARVEHIKEISHGQNYGSVACVVLPNLCVFMLILTQITELTTCVIIYIKFEHIRPRLLLLFILVTCSI